MDHVRVFEAGEGINTVQAELFPDISIGDAPEGAAPGAAPAAAAPATTPVMPATTPVAPVAAAPAPANSRGIRQ